MSKEEEELFAQLQLREGTDIEINEAEPKNEMSDEKDQNKGPQAYSDFVEEMAEHTPQRRNKPEMSVTVTLDMVGVKHEL